MRTFTIQTPRGRRNIGDGQPCFIVAELSANHSQSFEKAVALVKAAAAAGCDAVKLQTYTADTITINSRKSWFMVGGKDNPDAWKGHTLYELYQKAHTPWEWHEELQQRAESLGLVFFSTPFDETAVDFLETLKLPCYKIASYEMTHLPLLVKVAKIGKPVIMSVGFNSLEETAESVRALREGGARDIALLHCLNTYADQSDPAHTNLGTIRDLAERFDVVSGFSDNNGGIMFPILAAAVGAAIVEKHLVESHHDETFDKRFSIDPVEMKEMVALIRRNEKAVGMPHYGPVNEAEAYNLRFRRSIFAVENIRRGESFTEKNIRVIRPADGIAPKHYEELLGKHARLDIECGTPLSWKLVQEKGAR